jgi:small subunit ribosomal protein S6
LTLNLANKNLYIIGQIQKGRKKNMARIRHYETMFIVKSTLTQEEIEAQIATVKGNIEKNGGEIVSYDNMGSRALAYEIDKQKRGYYYVIYFKAPSESIKELERTYKVNENIIRFIFIKYDSKSEIKQWTAMSNEAAKKAAK